MSVEAPLNKVIGQRLRSLRENRRIPRERVALALEMGSENLRNYEAGKQQLKVTMLPTLADLYGMTVAELVIDLFDDRTPCDTVPNSEYGSDNNGTVNYNYTKPLRVSPDRLAPARVPSRELVAAGR